MDDPILTLVLDRIDSGFKAQDKRFDQFDSRFDQVDVRLNDHGKRLTAVEVGGCGRLAEHRELLGDGEPPPRWQRTKKIVVPTGIGAAIGAALWELLKGFTGK